MDFTLFYLAHPFSFGIYRCKSRRLVYADARVGDPQCQLVSVEKTGAKCQGCCKASRTSFSCFSWLLQKRRESLSRNIPAVVARCELKNRAEGVANHVFILSTKDSFEQSGDGDPCWCLTISPWIVVMLVLQAFRGKNLISLMSTSHHCAHFWPNHDQHRISMDCGNPGFLPQLTSCKALRSCGWRNRWRLPCCTKRNVSARNVAALTLSHTCVWHCAYILYTIYNILKHALTWFRCWPCAKVY